MKHKTGGYITLVSRSKTVKVWGVSDFAKAAHVIKLPAAAAKFRIHPGSFNPHFISLLKMLAEE